MLPGWVPRGNNRRPLPDLFTRQRDSRTWRPEKGKLPELLPPGFGTQGAPETRRMFDSASSSAVSISNAISARAPSALCVAIRSNTRA